MRKLESLRDIFELNTKGSIYSGALSKELQEIQFEITGSVKEDTHKKIVFLVVGPLWM